MGGNVRKRGGLRVWGWGRNNGDGRRGGGEM